MSATVNISFQISGVLNGEKFAFPTGGLYGPATLTTASDVKCIKDMALPATTYTEILSIGSGADIASAKLIVAISSVAVVYVWRTSASDADNNSVSAAAGIPLVLPAGTAVPYQSTSSNRADETAANISSIGAYSPAGSGVVRVFAIG